MAQGGSAAIGSAGRWIAAAREEVSRGRVRLWPSTNDGQVVEQKLNAIAVKRLGGTDEVADDLAARLSRQIGRLFYQHTVGDLDDDLVFPRSRLRLGERPVDLAAAVDLHPGRCSDQREDKALGVGRIDGKLVDVSAVLGKLGRW